MRRIGFALLTSLAVVLATPDLANARDEDVDEGPSDPVEVERYTDGGGVFVGYRVPIGTSAGRDRPGGGGGLRYTCSFFLWESGKGTDPAINLLPNHRYILRCHVEGSDGLVLGTPDIVVYDPDDPDQGRIATQREVDLTALDALTFPAPELTTSPPPDNLVVGFETWFHTETPDNPGGLPEGDVVTAFAGPLWATATAEAVSIDMDAGNGEPDSVFSCDEIAAPFDKYLDLDAQRPDCARYAYQYSSNNEETPGGTYTINARVTYGTYLETSANPVAVFQEELLGEVAEIVATVTQLQAVIK